MPTLTRDVLSDRNAEVRALLGALKAQEYAAGHDNDIQFNSLKGLWIVLLYSYFEFSVTRLLNHYSDFITDKRVKYIHLSEEILSFALNSELQAIGDTKRDNKWKKRRQLFEKRLSDGFVTLNFGCLQSELQNIWCKSLQTIFLVMGIPGDYLYNPRSNLYIDEIVEKRNSIAHGRDSASDVGRSYTTTSLENLYSVINAQIDFLYSSVESHLDRLGYISPNHASLYKDSFNSS